jgi:hypothetical protein
VISGAARFWASSAAFIRVSTRWIALDGAPAGFREVLHHVSDVARGRRELLEQLHGVGGHQPNTGWTMTLRSVRSFRACARAS